MAVLLLLYIVVEVVAVWAVGSLIGFLPTVGLLVAGAFLGSWLARREGGKAFRAFMETARAGKPAHTEITNGLLVALGGVLIMIPGFVSDVAGLLLLLPSRGLFRRLWLRRAERNAERQGVRMDAPMAAAPPFEQPRRTIVVDSEVVDRDEQSGGQRGQDGRLRGGGQPGFGMSK